MDERQDTSAANRVDAIRARAAQLKDAERKPVDTRDSGTARAVEIATAAVTGKPLPQDAKAPRPADDEAGRAPEPAQPAPEPRKAAQDAPDGDEGPMTWDTLADKLGVKKKDLYDVLVPLEEGGGVKLGELKAAIGKLRAVDDARAEVEQSRHAWTLKKGAEMEALQQLRDAMPPLPPGAEASFEAARKQIRETAFADFVASAPGWEKPQYQAQRFQLWDSMLRPYGITSEMVYAEAKSSNVLRFLDYAATLHDRFSKAQASAQRVPETGVKPGAGQAPAHNGQSRAFEKNRRLEENARVRDILRRG